MSLSKKLLALDEENKKKLEAQLQEKFPNSVEVQILLHLSRFVEWMEAQPWATTDASVAAQPTFDTIMSMLQEKISETEQKCMEKSRMFHCLRSSIQSAYTDKPIIELVHRLLEIYNQMNGMVYLEQASTSSDNTADSTNANGSTEGQSFDFNKNLETLRALLKENDDHIEAIQRKLKEREKLLFSQTKLEIEKLEISNDKSILLQDKTHKISQIIERINAEQKEIATQTESIIASFKPLFENISSLIYTKTEVMRNHILSKISDWNFNKQQAQVGWPVFSFSDFLQPLIPVCKKFATILLSTDSQTEKLVDIFTKIGAANKEALMGVQTMKNISRRMLTAFLKSCFVVDKQPPPTLLIDKVCSVHVRLLLGNQFLPSGHTSVVTCSLHLDDDIRRFYKANLENVKPEEENKKNVKNNQNTLTYDKQTDSFFVSFDKLKLHKLEKRKTKLDEDKTKLVTEQKSCLMFQTEITIGTESFSIEAFSVPIVVMTNVSQCLESEATIFWDNAFGHKTREPFTSPNGVLLQDFLEALNQRWAKTNERELNHDHLLYLARKLFPNMDEFSKCYVTKQMFNKEKVKGGGCIFPFTFWSWFYKAMKVVKDFFLDEWRDGKVYGFVDKGEAEAKLNECLVGTFLLRFSDSVPGGISIAYKENMQVPGCNHVEPWTKDELKQKSFSDSLRDLQYDSELHCLQYLYPSIPKDDAFGMYYSQTDENNREQVNPRYPKKAPIRVVRHDDGGSTAASNVSSTQSSAFQNMSPPPSVARISESSNGNEQAFSPLQLSLDHDPLLSQGSHDDQLDIPMMNEESDDPWLFFS